MSTVTLYCWCHSDSASVLLYLTVLDGKGADMVTKAINTCLKEGGSTESKNDNSLEKGETTQPKQESVLSN